jgi:hypothetical protein
VEVTEPVVVPDDDEECPVVALTLADARDQILARGASAVPVTAVAAAPAMAAAAIRG